MSIFLPPRIGDEICGQALSRYVYNGKYKDTNRYIAAIDFSADGTKMVGGTLIDNAVLCYSLSTPWEITTMGSATGTFQPSISGGSTANKTSCLGALFIDNGTRLWLTTYTGLSAGWMISYQLQSPYVWNSTTLLPQWEYEKRTSWSTWQANRYHNIRIRPDGKRMVGGLNNSTQLIGQLDFPVAWDFRNWTQTGLTAKAFTGTKMFVPPDGACVYREGRVSTGTNIADTYAYKYKPDIPWEFNATTMPSTAPTLDSLNCSPPLITDTINYTPWDCIYMTPNRMYISARKYLAPNPDIPQRIYQWDAIGT